MYSMDSLYDLEHTIAKDYLSGFRYPWEALAGLQDYIIQLGQTLPLEEYDELQRHIWVHKTAKIAPSAHLGSPCIIGPETEVRHCAYIRGNALIGKNCVVGNSVEIKNAVLFDGAQVPHFNYVGDSVLGYKAHMGAGAVTSNVRGDKRPVIIRTIPQIDTGRKKVGAMLGDYAEVGCNSVLNPGTVIGRHSNVYPVSCVRGVIHENSIYKTGGVIVTKKEG